MNWVSWDLGAFRADDVFRNAGMACMQGRGCIGLCRPPLQGGPRASPPPLLRTQVISRRKGGERNTDWLRYFDVVVVGCAKPRYFTERSNLFEVHTGVSLCLVWR